MVTICTPAWNRAGTLPRAFQSLLAQDNLDFEWIIIDDGSQDETEIVVKEMKEKTDAFPIRYIKKENGGRHTAINKGLEEAKGEIFFLLDSDDWLPPDAISKTLICFDSIAGEAGFAGIVGLKCFEDEKIVGATFRGDYQDFDFFDREKRGVYGDRAEVFYTEIFRKFPFPELPDERFLSERMNWYRIADAGYKMRWFNTNIYFCEYQADGLSAQRGKMRKNMGALRLETKELLQYKKVSLKEKCMYVGRYALLRQREGASYSQIGQELEISAILPTILSKIAIVYEKAIYNKKGNM